MASKSLNLPYVLLFGVILITMFIAGALVRPSILNAMQVKKDLAVAEQELTKQRNFLKSIDSRLAELQTNQEYERQLNVVLPQGDEIEDALRIVHRAGSEAGVLITSVENSSKGEQTVYKSLVVKGEAGLPTGVLPVGVIVEVKGTYQQVRMFIDKLEKSPRIMDITSIDLRKNEQTPDQVNGELKVRFYKYITSLGAL